MAKERLAANLAEVQFDPDLNTMSGICSLFGSMIITSVPTFMFPGAFKKTIHERFSSDTRKNKVRILWMHQESEPIGVPLELRETPEGLHFKAEIIETTRGSDALKLLRRGAITELSIGFDSIKQDMFDGRRAIEVLDKRLASPYNQLSEDEKRIYQAIRSKITEFATSYPVFRFVYEVRLWELSLVSWGADPGTYVAEVHSNYNVTDTNNVVNASFTVPRGTYNLNELREILSNQFFNYDLKYNEESDSFSIEGPEDNKRPTGGQGITMVVGKKKGEQSMTVQSVIFSKDDWDATEAKQWLKAHDLKNNKMDETDDTFRFRQYDPGDFDPKSFRTIKPAERKSEIPDMEQFTIIKRGSKYCLISKSTGKTLGCHPTKAGAIKQEAAIKANQSACTLDTEKFMLVDKETIMEQIRSLCQMMVELCSPNETTDEEASKAGVNEKAAMHDDAKEYRMKMAQIVTTCRAILELARMPMEPGDSTYPMAYAASPDEKHIGKKISGKRLDVIKGIRQSLDDLLKEVEEEEKKEEEKESTTEEEKASNATPKESESHPALNFDKKIQEAEAKYKKIIGVSPS